MSGIASHFAMQEMPTAGQIALCIAAGADQFAVHKYWDLSLSRFFISGPVERIEILLTNTRKQVCCLEQYSLEGVFINWPLPIANKTCGRHRWCCVLSYILSDVH